MMNARARWSFLAVPLLAALGCSDPVPLPAQGAISLSVGKPTTAVSQMTCPDSGRTYEVYAGSVPPSPTTPGDRVISGDNGSSITCSVRASGGGFAFSGSFTGVTKDMDHYPITVSFSDGVVDANKVSGTASVSVLTPVLAATFGSTAPCKITVINSQVKPGSIYATFSCPTISSPPSGLCSVNASVIVFENCSS